MMLQAHAQPSVHPLLRKHPDHYRKPLQQRINEIPFFLTTNRPDNSIVLASYGTSGKISLSANVQGPLWVHSLMMQSTGAFLIQLYIYDGERMVPMSSSGIHSSTLLGSGLKPYRLPAPIYTDELKRLVIVLTDISGASNTIYPCFMAHQGKNPVHDPTGKLSDMRDGGNRLTYPFFYTFDAGSITFTALQNREDSIGIGTNLMAVADFQLFQISYTSTGTWTLDMLDGNTGESIFNAPQDQHYQVDAGSFIGNQNYPTRWNVGRMFRRGQKIIVRSSDTSNAANTAYLLLAGRAINPFVRGHK